MKSKIKVVLTMLLAVMLLIRVPIQASEMASAEHITAIEKYIDALNLIQGRIFTLAPRIIFDGEGTSKEANDNEIKILSDVLNTVRKELVDQVGNTTSEGFSERDILLLLNAVNYMRSSLHELKLLNTQTAVSEKMTTLERYFNFRIYATNSIGLVNKLVLSK